MLESGERKQPSFQREHHVSEKKEHDRVNSALLVSCLPHLIDRSSRLRKFQPMNQGFSKKPDDGNGKDRLLLVSNSHIFMPEMKLLSSIFI